MTKPYVPTFGDLARRAAVDLIIGIDAFPYRIAPDVVWTRRDVEHAWGIVGADVLANLPPGFDRDEVWALQEFGPPEDVDFSGDA